MKKKKVEKWPVGRFFHSLNEHGEIKWQGYILQAVKKELYLIQTFDWLMGEKSAEQQLISLDQMKDWLFYETSEDMRYSSEYGTAKSLRYKSESAEKEIIHEG